MHREPLRHQERPQRDERDDKHREADSSNSLRDGDCTCDAEDLEPDEEHYFLAGDGAERVGGLEEAALGEEVESFG